ncbi:MAG: hypothetical protein Q9N02_05535, partial [Ghiorsea sp.]|nr:hypothetical protein [Ghiorsea sp.]
ERFVDFIETCSSTKKGSIKTILFPPAKKYFLDRYFSNYPSPYTENELVEELMSLHGFNRTSARIIINRFIEIGFLKNNHGEIKPQMLSQLIAVEHVLSSHDFKNGLPWIDIAKIINSNGYTKNSALLNIKWVSKIY